jgi:hypothetical protein
MARLVRDRCIADVEVVDSSSRSGDTKPDARLLNNSDNDVPVLAIQHSFDHELEDPPTSVSTKESEVRTRTLRGYIRSDLEHETLVPYRDRQLTGK